MREPPAQSGALTVSRDILIISNAPGELAAWVRPVAARLLERFADASITIALVPCPYASGREAATIRSWGMPLAVWTPTQTLAYLLTGRTPGGTLPGPTGAVLFLGGDQFFGVLAARRTGWPLLVYTETVGRWVSSVTRFMLSDRNPYLALRGRKVPPAKLVLVGNLMVDSVRPTLTPAAARERLGLSPAALVVGLLPGSKPFKVRSATPFMVEVVDRLHAVDRSIQFILHQSAFTPLELFASALNEGPEAVRGTRILTASGHAVMVTPGGARIRIVPPSMQFDGMQVDDLALTVPGTNTAELAVLGVPQLVLLPLLRPEDIPLEGLLGRLGNVPGLGPWVKRTLIRHLLKHLRFTALPNQRMGRMVTPELVGGITPDQAATHALELLSDHDRRRLIRIDLLQAMGYRGAAQAVADVLEEVWNDDRPMTGEVARPGSEPGA
ncbi:MAG: hypothetical protein VKO21_12320 [Candidatus Sericytochromatia bacterium]|nr:hypothetical protein [Candidatus Sericytochromatia bacterium]